MDSTTHSQNELVTAVRSVLTRDLLQPKYARWHSNSNPLWGHCYAASEALWYLLGDQRDWTPHVARDEDVTHWWLRHRHSGEILDPTAEQYTNHGVCPPYNEGRGCGFLTPQPSKRAREIINRVHAL
jgi:hypothetical protein